MSRSLAWKLGCCLVWGWPALVCANSAGGRHSMKMHVFAEPDNDTTLAIRAHESAGAPIDLKMVVFDGAGGSASVNTVSARQRDARFNGAVPVELEEYPKRQPEQSGITVRSYGEVGYRNDEMSWNKADPSGTPNILSELQWYNVHSAVITAGTDITIDTNWQLDGKISYGQVVEGQNQDSDYFLDDRQGEFSRSNNVADDGMSIDLKAGVGYHLTFGNPRRAPYWRVTPKVGYAFHSQQFTMTEGMQTVLDYDGDSQPDIPLPVRFSGLHSTYEGTWFGPWGGLTTELALTDRLSLDASFEYHWIDYQGTGHWNLRDDLQQPISFKHSAEGEGIVLSAVARYRITPDWLMRLSVEYQNWLANDNGRDKMLFAGGSSAEMQLNEVKWTSYGVNLGIEYAF